MNAATTITRSRKTDRHKKSPHSQSKKRNTPKLNSTSDLLFSIVMLSITPLVLVCKYIYDIVFYSRGNSHQSSMQYVSIIDPHSDSIVLNLNKSVSICTCVTYTYMLYMHLFFYSLQLHYFLLSLRCHLIINAFCMMYEYMN
jgi:hypothetical protein